MFDLQLRCQLHKRTVSNGVSAVNMRRKPDAIARCHYITHNQRVIDLQHGFNIQPCRHTFAARAADR